MGRAEAVTYSMPQAAPVCTASSPHDAWKGSCAAPPTVVSPTPVPLPPCRCFQTRVLASYTIFRVIEAGRRCCGQRRRAAWRELRAPLTTRWRCVCLAAAAAAALLFEQRPCAVAATPRSRTTDVHDMHPSRPPARPPAGGPVLGPVQPVQAAAGGRRPGRAGPPAPRAARVGGGRTWAELGRQQVEAGGGALPSRLHAAQLQATLPSPLITAL